MPQQDDEEGWIDINIVGYSAMPQQDDKEGWINVNIVGYSATVLR